MLRDAHGRSGRAFRWFPSLPARRLAGSQAPAWEPLSEAPASNLLPRSAHIYQTLLSRVIPSARVPPMFSQINVAAVNRILMDIVQLLPQYGFTFNDLRIVCIVLQSGHPSTRSVINMSSREEIGKIESHSFQYRFGVPPLFQRF
jgi:hypothetical protein